MTKRRDKGDGSISSRPRKDGRMSGSFYVKDAYGRRKRQYVYGHSKAEVKEKLRIAKRAYEEGTFLPSKQRDSLASWMEFWLETKRATGELQPGTLFSYRHMMTRHIVPKLGTIALCDLTPEIIQVWVNELAECYKPNTVRQAYTALSSALKGAVEMKKIKENPCKMGITKPRVKKRKYTVIDAGQARFLVETAAGSPLQSMLVVAIATGMRRGELRALHWEQIDIERGIIHVRANAFYLPDETGKYRHGEGGPKTEAGMRDLTLPRFAVEALRAHRIRQNEQRLARRNKWHNLGLVFTTRDGNYYNLRSLGTQLKRLLVSAGLPPMRFHDLRHSAATILFAMGINPKIVQERLGHSDIRTTLEIYGHVTQVMDEQAMEDLDRAYRQADPGA